MRFSFKSRSGVASQVRKIAQGQVEKALKSARDGQDFNETVHGLRRRCKKLRGLLRLVKPHIEDFAAENKVLRDAARMLGGARDARVMIETLDGLNLGSIAEVARTSLARHAHTLAARGANDEVLKGFRAEFGRLGERIDGWAFDENGFELVEDGLVETYRRFRQGFEEADETGRADTLHEWRKHAKYHSHHLALLAQAAPDVLGARRSLMGSLGDLIGDHHNLAVLDETLRSQNIADLTTIQSALRTRQGELAAAALDLGRQLAVEKPHAVRRLFKAYWLLLPEHS